MVMAVRTLKLRANGAVLDVPVHIFAPELEPTGAWRCDHEIAWPDGSSKKSTYGVDSMQALILALQMIGAELHSSAAHGAGQLFWDKPGNGYGFPVMPSLRDRLVGEDAQYL